MGILEIVQSKPVLIGLHLGFAIIGIDAFLWLLGQLRSNHGSNKAMIWSAAVGVVGYVLSWLTGGFYYVVYYGSLVKPAIKASTTPWVHTIIMETKEHIFLFIIPVSMVVLCLIMLGNEDLDRLGLRKYTQWLAATAAGLGLLIGLMGFIISAAARWGVMA